MLIHSVVFFLLVCCLNRLQHTVRKQLCWKRQITRSCPVSVCLAASDQSALDTEDEYQCCLKDLESKVENLP